MEHYECEHCEHAVLYECATFRLEAVRLHNVWLLCKYYGQLRETGSRVLVDRENGEN
jgi:hypothetical protein